METNLQTQITDIQSIIVLTRVLPLVMAMIFTFAINLISLVPAIPNNAIVTRTQTTLITTRRHAQSSKGAQQIKTSEHYNTKCT
jgi:hypothetical protein